MYNIPLARKASFNACTLLNFLDKPNSKVKFLAGSPSKTTTGLIIGLAVGFLAILLLGGSVLVFWRRRHKGYRREIFVDVVGLCHMFDNNFISLMYLLFLVREQGILAMHCYIL